MVAQACPAGANTAFRVWQVFRQLQWHPPDQPKLPDVWGITWYELPLVSCFSGTALPVWIYHKKSHLPTPYAFHSEEVAIQKEESRSLWHQVNTLRAVVCNLENTLQTPPVPEYTKTGAPSLIRLKFHKSLLGGIASRRVLPCPDHLLHAVQDASLPNQCYPHHVRLATPFVTKTDPLEAPYVEIPFQNRSGLYQRIK